MSAERGGTQKGTGESKFTTGGTEEGTTEYSEYTEGEHKTGWQVHCEHHSGQLRRETSQAKAERIVGEELRWLGWHEGDLTRRSKGDPEKLALAARLRRERRR